MEQSLIEPKPRLKRIQLSSSRIKSLKEMKMEPTLCGFNAANSAFFGALIGMVLDMMLINRHPKFLYDISIENAFRTVEIANNTNTSELYNEGDVEKKFFMNTLTLILSLQVLAGILLMRGIYKHRKFLLMPWIVLKTIAISYMTIYFLNLSLKSKYMAIVLSLVYCDLTLFTILCLLKLYHRFKMEERMSICVVDLLSIQICSQIKLAQKMASNAIPGVHLNPTLAKINELEKNAQPLQITAA